MNERLIKLLRPSPSAALPGPLALLAAWVATCLALMAAPAQAQGSSQANRRTADQIVAVVGTELVTRGEVDRRVALARQEAEQRKENIPPDTVLRERMLETLIDERIVLVHARDSGFRVDEPEIDRAVQNVALQNNLSQTQLREQLRKEGMDYTRFRAQLRDQLLIERVREREVLGRIKVSDSEIDEAVAKERARLGRSGETEFNVAQILVSLPDNADAATQARLKDKAEALLARVKARENFAALARELSDDAKTKAAGGELGLRGASRLPDEFVAAVKPLKVGEIAPALTKTGAGFHVLKLVERREADDLTLTHTRARHILMRPSAQASADTVARQMLDFKRQVESGARKFEDLAKQHSLDGSSEQGGDLGLVAAGTFVPEFEVAMNALAVGAISQPVTSRFGIHLIQVVERKDIAITPRQMREQARNALREQRYEKAVSDWIAELRQKAYVERRDAP